MAQKRDSRVHQGGRDPQAQKIGEALTEELKRVGWRGVIVETTPEMTMDEEEMALFEGFLREGYGEAEAAERAKRMLVSAKRVELGLKKGQDLP